VSQTRRMAIANYGTCVSFCNQPKVKFGYLTRVTQVCRFAGGGIWLRQESLRHILASPGYAPGTIAVNVTCKRLAAYIPIYLQPFLRYSSPFERASRASRFNCTQFLCTPPLVCLYACIRAKGGHFEHLL